MLLETQSYTRQASGRVPYAYLMMHAPYDNADRLNAPYDAAHLTPGSRNLRFQTCFTKVEHWMTHEFRPTSVGPSRCAQARLGSRRIRCASIITST